MPSRHRSAGGVLSVAGLSRGLVFIYVYRLAMDARTLRGDDVAGGKYPSLLEDFQTGTASMAR